MKKALLLLTCLVVAGCGGRRIKTHIPNTALLVAYFDMKDAPAHLEWAAVNQVGNPQSWYLRIDDGLVYAENLPAGTYYLSSFGGGDDTNCLVRQCCFGGNHVQMSFNIPEDRALALVKAKPGVNFMGSYRFVRESKTKTGAVFKGMFASGGSRFDLVPIDLPAEREVLQRLVQWIRDTGWEPVVRDRLDRMHLEAGIIREPQSDLISSSTID